MKKRFLAVITLITVFTIPYTACADSEYGAGMYKIGVDMPAGEYILFCDSDVKGYFCVSSDSNQKDIIQNENFEYNSIITVNDGEYFDLERSYAVPSSDNPQVDTSGSGMFEVGKHIPSGEYKLIGTSDVKGYYCIYDDSRQDHIVANQNFNNSTYVTVSDGQYLLLDRCYIENIPEELMKQDLDDDINKELNRYDEQSVQIKSISEDDFLVSGEGFNDNVNIFQYMLDNEYDIHYAFYLQDVDTSIEGVIQTYRGIHIGDSQESVFTKYGDAKVYPFDKKEDALYNFFIEEGDDLNAQIMESQCLYYVAYNYMDNAQIVFYFNTNNDVSWIIFNIGNQYKTYSDDKETVVYVQTQLNNLGYDCGTPDGIMGNNTKSALGKFQKDNGLFENGIIDGQVLSLLNGDIENVSSPENISIDETEWDNWTSTEECMLFPFMKASTELVDFNWGNPKRDGDHVEIECYDENDNAVTDFLMYYGVDEQKVIYTGLYTDNPDVFSSEVFREYCTKLMMAYNIRFENGEPILNLTKERAREIVDYSIDNAEHCLADNMRIRVVREDGYYSFHLEY